MADALARALLEVLQWDALSFMLIGVAVGFWVGLLPGLGGGTTLALMLPFVYKMQPVQAFAFLLGLRYTFGSLYLWNGLSIVPVLVGFFAIPEIIDLAVRGTAVAGDATVSRVTGVAEGVRDSVRHFWLTIRCSIIGTYIGIVPGWAEGSRNGSPMRTRCRARARRRNARDSGRATCARYWGRARPTIPKKAEPSSPRLPSGCRGVLQWRSFWARSFLSG